MPGVGLTNHDRMNEGRPDTLVNYSLFTAADADEMSRLLGDVFALRDPPAAALGLTRAEFEAFVRLYRAKAHAEGLTIVARSVATGEMIGALLAEDSGSEPPDGLGRLSAKFDPIFDLLGQLDSEYSGGRARQRGDSVISFFWVLRRAMRDKAWRNNWSRSAWRTQRARVIASQ